jgi:hypothetical protein
MLACPVLRTILLQRSMRLPGAVLGPSPLLLPRDCLLLGTLRLLPARLGTLGLLLWRSLLLSLLGPLLRLLSGLRVGLLLLRRPLLLRLVLLRLLGSLLRLLSGLRVLLRLLSTLLFRLALIFLLLLVLRVRRDNRPEHEY